MDTISPWIGHLMPKSLVRMLSNNRGEIAPPPATPPPATPPPATPPPATPPPATPPPATPPAGTNWFDGLSDDLKVNPNVTKYKTQEDQVKGHLELATLLGHEKVALPKDENDLVAIQTLNRALGVPDVATGYEIEAPEPIPGMENMEFGMEEFKAIAHKHSLTPAQAKGMMTEYRDMLTQIKTTSETSYVESVNAAKAKLTSEWGLKYDENIKLGQLVMNKFSGNKEAFDHINGLLGTDPVSQKFLATIGAQFSEGSLGDTGTPMPGFTKTPSEAKTEYDGIMNNKSDPYWSGVHKEAPVVAESVRQERISYVESLLKMQNAGNAK